MSEDTRNRLGHGNMTKMITLFIIGFFILGPRECWGLGDANDTKWWETALFYDVSWPFSEHSHFHENLSALIEDIDNMKMLRVDALCLQPIFPWARDPYTIVNYTAVNETLGTMDDIVELIEKAHKNGIKVILGIVPFYTSDQHAWFQKWDENDVGYNEFYLSASGSQSQKTLLQSKERNITYQAVWGQPELPMLNWDMESARRQLIEEMFTFWLRKGADGFHILKFWDYIVTTTGERVPTCDESTKKHLNEIRKHLGNWTTKDNPTSKYLAVELGDGWHTWSLYRTMKDLPDVVLLNNALISVPNGDLKRTNARGLQEDLVRQFAMKPPGASIRWMLRYYLNASSEVVAQSVAAHTMFMMLLPGQARVLVGDELMKTDEWYDIKKLYHSSRSHCYACPFAIITALMKLPVFRQGEYDLKTLNNESVLALRRYMSDDPNVYTAVINLKDREEKISPIELFPDLGERLEILFNTDTNATTIGSVPHQDSVSVPAHSGMVLMSSRTKRETNKNIDSNKKESEGKTEKSKISGEKEPSGGGEGGTTAPTADKGESAMPSKHHESGTTETNKDVGTPEKESEGTTEKPKISGEKKPSGGGEGGTTVPTVGKGESAMPSKHHESGTTETNKDVGTPEKESEGTTEKPKISGEKKPSGGGEGGTTVPTVGKGESAVPSKHHESGTTETNKDVGTPENEGEGKTEKNNISGEKEPSGGGEGGTTVPTVGKGESAMPSKHHESGTTETNKDVGTPEKESEGTTEKPKISGEKKPSGGGEGGTTVPTVGTGESAMPSKHHESGTTETNKDVGTPENEGEGKTEKNNISGQKEPSGGGEGGTTVPTVGKGESAMPSKHHESGTTETNKDVGTPEKESEGTTEKPKISGEKKPSGGGEGGTTVPTVGKGESAVPSKHHESGTTETNKDVGTPINEGEGRTEKPKISGENDQGRGDVEDKSVGKGGEKPSRSGDHAAAKGKEDERVHERVEDDPKGKRKEINNDEGHVRHEKTTGWGVLKGIGKFWRSIGQLGAGYWRKKLETASRPKTYRWNRQ